MNEAIQLSSHAREFVFEVRRAIDQWHDRPLLADLGTSPTRARLIGMAADLVRLLDSADTKGWDLRDLAYQLAVGSDGDEQDEGRVDAILASPIDDDPDRQFDAVLCKNWEPDDVAAQSSKETKASGASRRLLRERADDVRERRVSRSS